MTPLIGTYETAHASKYLQQLCKHFSHKIEATFSEDEGLCHFVMGPAFMTASEKTLTVRFELTAPDQADAARHVIDAHLVRFAHREDFQSMTWST